MHLTAMNTDASNRKSSGLENCCHSRSKIRRESICSFGCPIFKGIPRDGECTRYIWIFQTIKEIPNISINLMGKALLYVLGPLHQLLDSLPLLSKVSLVPPWLTGAKECTYMWDNALLFKPVENVIRIRRVNQSFLLLFLLPELFSISCFHCYDLFLDDVK